MIFINVCNVHIYVITFCRADKRFQRRRQPGVREVPEFLPSPHVTTGSNLGIRGASVDRGLPSSIC